METITSFPKACKQADKDQQTRKKDDRMAKMAKKEGKFMQEYKATPNGAGQQTPGT